jgi:nucleoside-diphosphate-sugar epimerase
MILALLVVVLLNGACKGALAYSLFIAGLGYLGREIARQSLDAGEFREGICGTCRSEEKSHSSVKIHSFDGSTPMSLDAVEDLRASTHVLCCCPPAVGGMDPFLEHCGAHLLASEALIWVGYISSTGVYGDAKGGWVTEDTLPVPLLPKPRARLRAERSWQALGVQLHIFRLAGLYGPGRSALDTLIKVGGDLQLVPGSGDGETCASRIHVADAARVVRLSMMKAMSADSQLLNVADMEPATRKDVFTYAHGLLGAPAPFDGCASPYRSARGGGSKRVDSSKLQHFLEESRESYLYPTYREGLNSIASGYFYPS